MKNDNPHIEYGWNELPPEAERIIVILSVCILGVTFLYLLVFSMFGQAAPDDIVVYNHTGNVISASNKFRAEQIIQNNSLARLRGYRGGRDQTATPTLFVVTAKKVVWSYRTDYPPPEYLTRRDNDRTACGYQIEADGVIYAVKPDTDKPLDTLPPQPPGFPLIPSPHQRIWNFRSDGIHKTPCLDYEDF